jgi:hypothetical protein
MGTGYALFLTNSPAEAYTLDETATQPTCISGEALAPAVVVGYAFQGLFRDQRHKGVCGVQKVADACC